MRSYFIPALLFVFLLVPSSQVSAHPLGNFSISHYSAIRVGKETVELRYIIDMEKGRRYKGPTLQRGHLSRSPAPIIDSILFDMLRYFFAMRCPNVAG